MIGPSRRSSTTAATCGPRPSGTPPHRLVTLVSAEPIGLGSVFRGTFKGAGTSTMEIGTFDRPATWTTRTTQATLPFRLVGTAAAAGEHSTRLTMRIELIPTGVMALLGPVVRLMMQPTAKANLVRIKAAVELPDDELRAVLRRLCRRLVQGDAAATARFL